MWQSLVLCLAPTPPQPPNPQSEQQTSKKKATKQQHIVSRAERAPNMTYTRAFYWLSNCVDTCCCTSSGTCRPFQPHACCCGGCTPQLFRQKLSQPRTSRNISRSRVTSPDSTHPIISSARALWSSVTLTSRSGESSYTLASAYVICTSLFLQHTNTSKLPSSTPPAWVVAVLLRPLLQQRRHSC